MKLDSLKDMVLDYERITREHIDFNGFFFDGSHSDGRHFKYFPGVGFLFWGLREYKGERYFAMLETYGKVAGMVPYIKEVMNINGLTKIVTYTSRNPKAHIRKWKMERHPSLDYDAEGHHYFVLTGTVENLR